MEMHDLECDIFFQFYLPRPINNRNLLRRQAVKIINDLVNFALQIAGFGSGVGALRRREAATYQSPMKFRLNPCVIPSHKSFMQFPTLFPIPIFTLPFDM